MQKRKTGQPHKGWRDAARKRHETAQEGNSYTEMPTGRLRWRSILTTIMHTNGEVCGTQRRQALEQEVHNSLEGLIWREVPTCDDGSA